MLTLQPGTRAHSDLMVLECFGKLDLDNCAGTLTARAWYHRLTSDHSSCDDNDDDMDWNSKKIMNISIKLINLPVYFTLDPRKC